MTIQFPQELIDAIIDYFSRDFSGLKACSLVCRAWVFRTRFHLFRRCTLLPKNIVDFSDLLRSPTCTFLRNVSSVKATRYYWHQHDPCFNEIAENLRRLTNVRTVEMTLSIVISLNSTSASVDAFFRTGFVTAFPKVIRLILTCNFDGRQPAPLVEMICLFPALQELRIHDMSGTSAHPPSSAVPPVGLHCLKLGGDSPGPILAWLNMFNHLPNVNSLTLHDPVTNSQLKTVRTALQRLGGAITHLDIALTWLTEFRDIATTVFDLSLHPNLRTMTIRDSSWGAPDQFDPEPMILLICRLAARALECFSLDLNLSLYWTFKWAALDAFLCPERFPRLRSVIITDHGGHDNAHEFLSEALPSLAASRVLRTESDYAAPVRWGRWG